MLRLDKNKIINGAHISSSQNWLKGEGPGVQLTSARSSLLEGFSAHEHQPVLRTPQPPSGNGRSQEREKKKKKNTLQKFEEKHEGERIIQPVRSRGDEHVVDRSLPGLIDLVSSE
jgi:hypothetical protein